MKNIDYIKSLDVEDMAEFISAITYCADTDCNTKDCYIKRNGMEQLCRLTSYYSSGAKQWLNEERNEN